jgi:hypothetical protein
MSRSEAARRYPVVGGLTAWRVPLLTVVLAGGGLALGSWELAAGVAVIGGVASRLIRRVVVEVASTGLRQGVMAGSGAVVARKTLPWPAVASVHTDWRRPGDDSALATVVRGHDGTEVRLSTAMGLGSYWACLADVIRGAPWALRTGLTDEVLDGGPPTRSQTLSAAAVAGALATLLVAMAGIHYIWAQGPSWLSRYLQDVGRDVGAAPGPDAGGRERRPRAGGLSLPD